MIAGRKWPLKVGRSRYLSYLEARLINIYAFISHASSSVSNTFACIPIHDIGVVHICSLFFISINMYVYHVYHLQRAFGYLDSNQNASFIVYKRCANANGMYWTCNIVESQSSLVNPSINSINTFERMITWRNKFPRFNTWVYLSFPHVFISRWCQYS